MAPADGDRVEQRLRRLFSERTAGADSPDAPPPEDEGLATPPEANRPVVDDAAPAPDPPSVPTESHGTQERPEAIPAGPGVDVIRFGLGDAHFALPLGDVREVQPLPPLTRVPNRSSAVLGLANLRGTIVPVFDVRDRLALPPAPPAADARILVLEADGNLLAVVADRVSGTARLPPPTGDAPVGGAAGLIAGVGDVEGCRVTLLSAAALIDLREVGR